MVDTVRGAAAYAAARSSPVSGVGAAHVHRQERQPEILRRPGARPRGERDDPAAARGEATGLEVDDFVDTTHPPGAGGGGDRDGVDVARTTSRMVAGGDIGLVLRRAGERVRSMARLFLGVDAPTSDGLAADFRARALAALHDAAEGEGPAAFAGGHAALLFEGVSLTTALGGADPAVGLAVVRIGELVRMAPFGVGFDMETSQPVREYRSGWYVDTGLDGARVASHVLDWFRAQPPPDAVDGVAVVVRADDSGFPTTLDGGRAVVFDVLVR